MSTSIGLVVIALALWAFVNHTRKKSQDSVEWKQQPSKRYKPTQQLHGSTTPQILTDEPLKVRDIVVVDASPEQPMVPTGVFAIALLGKKRVRIDEVKQGDILKCRISKIDTKGFPLGQPEFRVGSYRQVSSLL